MSEAYPLRLQKFLARSGVASRRASENLMTAGRVKVNGVVVTELGSKVDPLRDVVEVDGKRVTWGAEPVYLLLNKPAGYVTTMSDPHARHTVAELVPAEEHPGLFPVGRLDQDTTGVLLFMTDGELSHQLLGPRHHVAKTYEAVVEGVPTPSELARLEAGIEIEERLTLPAKARIIARGLARGRSKVELVLTEGKTHQVKNMLEAVGHPVVSLHRSAFGPIVLGNLAEGSWRMLDDAEVASLRACI